MISYHDTQNAKTFLITPNILRLPSKPSGFQTAKAGFFYNFHQNNELMANHLSIIAFHHQQEFKKDWTIILFSSQIKNDWNSKMLVKCSCIYVTVACLFQKSFYFQNSFRSSLIAPLCSNNSARASKKLFDFYIKDQLTRFHEDFSSDFN